MVGRRAVHRPKDVWVINMKNEILLTVFTDPMMGLSYESEPILDRLQAEYGDRLSIRYVMSVLVRDVSDFMTDQELALPPKEGIARYCKRLAAIYKSEESIGHLPIRMDGFHLFDTEHRSSEPLCLAYKAAQLADPGKADAFLTALRHATVLGCRPTTHFDEILRVVRAVVIDETAFSACFHNGSAEAALQRDLDLTYSLGIRSLPAYVFQHSDKALLLQSFDYRDFVNAIEQVCR